jgi:hypothetical protein
MSLVVTFEVLDLISFRYPVLQKIFYGFINFIQIYTIKIVKTLPKNTNRCLVTFKRSLVLQIVR